MPDETRRALVPAFPEFAESELVVACIGWDSLAVEIDWFRCAELR